VTTGERLEAVSGAARGILEEDVMLNLASALRCGMAV
jgi:hypothetical protein